MSNVVPHPTAVAPLGAWLAELPDERLVRLLEVRPDLTQPPPGSIAALAARAQTRQSVKAATDDLDFLRLAVLDALLLLHADGEPVPLPKLVAMIGAQVDEDDLNAAVDVFRDQFLPVRISVGTEGFGFDIEPQRSSARQLSWWVVCATERGPVTNTLGADLMQSLTADGIENSQSSVKG